MNRTELQRLAETRALDAKALFDAECWSGLYYLIGYAVECALKACIAKQTNLHDFPDKGWAHRCYTHDLSQLLEIAGLKSSLDLMDLAFEKNKALARNWQIATAWNEKARYELNSEVQAAKLYHAVTNDQHGVLPWITTHW